MRVENNRVLIQAEELGALHELDASLIGLREEHYYENEWDHDESGNRILVGWCHCGADWPCDVAALIMAYDLLADLAYFA